MLRFVGLVILAGEDRPDIADGAARRIITHFPKTTRSSLRMFDEPGLHTGHR